MLLLDSDIVIEVQRGRAKAAEWLKGLEEEIALPAAVSWELLFGSRNKGELQKSERFLEAFAVEAITPHDSLLVQKLVSQHVLSTGLSLPDFLIAAQAINRNAVLVTFNQKHFGVIAGLRTLCPYDR